MRSGTRDQHTNDVSQLAALGSATAELSTQRFKRLGRPSRLEKLVCLRAQWRWKNKERFFNYPNGPTKDGA